MWEISIPSIQFFYELKTDVKNYLLKKIRSFTIDGLRETAVLSLLFDSKIYQKLGLYETPW